jgi:hypothetical protein
VKENFASDRQTSTLLPRQSNEGKNRNIAVANDFYD